VLLHSPFDELDFMRLEVFERRLNFMEALLDCRVKMTHCGSTPQKNGSGTALELKVFENAKICGEGKRSSI
jgi:hypothetical protein